MGEEQRMEKRAFLKRYGNCIPVLAAVVINALLIGAVFDYYYDLNDDTLMKDIMSGGYAGVPDGHNMQTLYPLGFAVSLLYRLCGEIPWYGLFLFVCQFGCLFLVGVRTAGLLQKKREDDTGAYGSGMIAAVLLTVFLWGSFLTHLAEVQYTITCALLSATGIFWLLTMPERDTRKDFFKEGLPSLLLFWLAYQLRTEMLLLTLPFAALAGLFSMVQESRRGGKACLLRYLAASLLLLLGMGMFSGADAAAYASEEWKDFRAFFDARTTVYDFYPEAITQDTYSAELEELGVSENQQELLRNYNFGLDEKIDTELLSEVADFAQVQIGGNRDWAVLLRQRFAEYLYRTTHSEDAPYNLLVLCLCAAVLVLGIADAVHEKKEPLFQRYAVLGVLLLYVLLRTAIWMFLLLRGRYPERITHSLYLTEIFLLLAMLLRLGRTLPGAEGENGQGGFCRLLQRGVLRGLCLVMLLICILNAGHQVRLLQQRQTERESVNQERQAIERYCAQHPDCFYFEDVYSTVSFSEKLFAKEAGGEYRGCNYELLGGWMCQSPLYRDKLHAYGITGAGEALLSAEGVYLIVSDTEAQNGFSWVTDYYKEQGIDTAVVCQERIGEYYGVYRVDEVSR